jgi:hypothetical protein
VSDPGGARRRAAEAWRFRHAVESEAALRFARLGERLLAIGADAALTERARAASREEERHAALCAELAAEYGAALPPGPAEEPAEVAPASLPLRARVLYEVVAACCVAETESVAVLTTLLDAAPRPRVREVLHELARDEVQHARLGWAHLAGEHAAGETAFLAPLVPAMLEGNAPPDLFLRPDPDDDDEALLAEGVLPRTLQRQVFTTAMTTVVFPGLERFGVDAGPARAWLARRSA